MQEETHAAYETIHFIAADGYALSGSYFPAPCGNKTPVLICPATGVKQGFYYAFAQWLSEQGHPRCALAAIDRRAIGKVKRYVGMRKSVHGALAAAGDGPL